LIMGMFKGLGVAMITPFTADRSVDIEGLKRLTNHLIAGGVDYLVVLGTTGESVVLDADEKSLVLETVLEVNQGRLPVVLGVGGNDTAKVCREASACASKGIQGLLSVSPYYNKPSQAGIYEHYKSLAGSTDIPIILYNVPGRTSSNMLPETTLRLAHDFPGICAIKEASGNIEQVMRIIDGKPNDFLVISGDDALTLPMLACGADGVISVVANAFPEQFSKVIANGRGKDLDTARKFHYQLLEITNLLFAEGNPAGIKEVAQILGICDNYLRLPLVNVSPTTSAKMKEVIALKALSSSLQ